jgi:NADH:ubiquinone oxidoreductase subunit 5 (subunit L)/multisubunit Na+/H+ antiporter MnhA subunit
MGGLRKTLPFAFVAMGTGVLAISGVPGFSGFFSKDAVVYGALETGHPWLYAVGVITAGITAYYMFRLLFVTFFGAYRGEVDPSDLGIRHPELAGTAAMASSSGHHPEEEEPHHHAPSWLMSGPVALLILPTVLIGWLDAGGNSPWKRFFAGFFPHSNEVVVRMVPVNMTPPPFSELVSTAIVFAVVVAGFAVAFLRYYAGPALRDAVARLRTETIRMPGVLANAYYFDAAYEALLVRPAYLLGRWFYRVVDPHVIDAGVRDVPAGAQWLGHLFRSFQTGLVRAYALTIAAGVVAFVAYYAIAFTGGAR